MAEVQSIDPFPADIDRDQFGHWLSGLTDGEGCFYLGFHKEKRGSGYRPDGRFSIRLRHDDLPILRLIQCYFNCGRIRYVEETERQKGRPYKSRAQYDFAVHNPNPLFKIIIPHFEQYPLRAKKARDFVIWRKAVELLWEVRQVRQQRVSRGRGFGRKWGPERLEQFRKLYIALRSGRRPDADSSSPRTTEYIRPQAPTPGLFDGLDK